MLPNFRESNLAEARLPRRTLLGNLVNRGNVSCWLVKDS